MRHIADEAYHIYLALGYHGQLGHTLCRGLAEATWHKKMSQKDFIKTAPHQISGAVLIISIPYGRCSTAYRKIAAGRHSVLNLVEVVSDIQCTSWK